MNKMFYIFFYCVLFTKIVSAQFDEQQFFTRVNSIYHNLKSTDTKNFATTVTSDYFEITTKGFLDNEVYSPVEFIWQSPDKMYFFKRPIPADIDTFAQKGIRTLQNDLQEGLKGILIDWQRFLGGNILDEMPESFKIYNEEDVVYIEFETTENNLFVKKKLYFGVNALCFKIETYYESLNQKMITYPVFVLIDQKWLCTKWTVKILQSGEIVSGFTTDLTSKQLNKGWFPIHALITVQTKEKLNKTFTRIYKFRNLRINKDFKIVEK